MHEGNGRRLTQKALVLESGLIGKVVVSESIADYHGNPCTTTTGPPPPPPPSAARGWMTGGGRINSVTAGKVTHGFRLGCTPANDGNNIQVSYAGGGFHSTGDFLAKCDNGLDLRKDSGNPNAGFDTLEGRAKGGCNGQDAGPSTPSPTRGAGDGRHVQDRDHRGRRAAP